MCIAVLFNVEKNKLHLTLQIFNIDRRFFPLYATFKTVMLQTRKRLLKTLSILEYILDKKYYIISYIISYHIIYHIISYRISYHIISYHIVSYRIISYYNILYYIILYYIILYYIILYYIILYYIIYTVPNFIAFYSVIGKVKYKIVLHKSKRCNIKTYEVSGDKMYEC